MNQNDGLWVFAFVVAANVIGLLVDLLLMKSGIPQVTEIARRNPDLAGLILAFNVLGVLGLAYHFWARNGNR